MTPEIKRPKPARPHATEVPAQPYRCAVTVRAASRTGRDAGASARAAVAPPEQPLWKGILDDFVTEPLIWLGGNTWARRIGLVFAGLFALSILAAGALWALLASGPLSLDIATPWIKAAIAENLGSQFDIDIGGTVLERDEHGRTAM